MCACKSALKVTSPCRLAQGFALAILAPVLITIGIPCRLAQGSALEIVR